jgi:signal transduction histidine kinase
LVKIRRTVEEYIREARQSIWDLRSPRLAQSDLPKALRQACERAIGERRGHARLHGHGHATSLRAGRGGAAAAHRAGGGEQNAVQHGRATRVGMEIAYDDNQTRLRVSDDGCGFDPVTLHGANGHYGLISMRERGRAGEGAR